MAAKTQNKVKDYVYTKNGVDDHVLPHDQAGAMQNHTPNEDLKVYVPNPGASHRRDPPQQNGTKRTRYAQSTANQSRPLSPSHKTLLDTDAGSIDDVSTLPDDRYDDLVADNRTKQSHRPVDGKLNARAYRILQDVDSAKQPGHGLPRMQGDSYPSTTDGRLSAASLAEISYRNNQQSDVKPTSRLVETDTGSQRRRGSEQKQLPVSNGPPKTETQHREADQVLFAKPEELTGSMTDEVNRGFSFAIPVASMKSVPARLQPSDDQAFAPESMRSQISPSTNTAYPPSGADGADHERRNHGDAQVGSIPGHHQPVGPRPAITAHVSSHTQEQNLVEVAEHDYPSDPLVHTNNPVEAQMERDLEYEPSSLYQMQFNELRAGTFDFPPGIESSLTFGDALSDSLEAGLHKTQKLQLEFFKSLTIKQWEECGDWFLDRYGDIMDKLKSSRRERRKAALVFESEVERRHHAVARKRTIMEDALSEMKTSGAQLLQGTPKRAKKA
ncbi:hypothetical protein BAUCODRAFT_37147 [Baudoinia panamericana UAMH 10762]|uniref:Extracellular mutant protein 11 C-terminal domain-containing protein n=1 Tax=Baudoinia panamericana (strain UAMH 10762) TaxID=717646 RepID=M2N3A9_BAUPA|nr:uncharacterized protein BAUCODRAFT_37147 [Baudoinia panamericana UAMH 10762]EMC93464.1 hypothetical protein BAUCODRAFT_37147 [Baudoinia panamericana UAMH 10762]